MEIRPGFSWASLGAWIGLIGIIVFLCWSATKKTDVDNYAKGAQHYEVTENNYPLAPRCGQLFSVQDMGKAKK